VTERVEKVYRELGDREKTISCLRLKYELWHFAGKKTEAEAVVAEINSLIEENDMSGLLVAHHKLVNKGSGYEKFVATFTSRLKNMCQILKNSNIKMKRMKRPSKAMLAIVERNTDWSIENFLEFELN
jgi:hypothetical protein